MVHINIGYLPVDDLKQSQTDITKARNILGWKPKVERAEGLQKSTITLKHCHQLSGQNCLKNLFQNNLIV